MGTVQRRVIGGCVVILAAGLCATAASGQESTGAASPAGDLAAAQMRFLSGRFVEAAAITADLRSETIEGLAAYELRTSALHFELKRLIGDADNKGRALRQCAECNALLDAFMEDWRTGRELAKTLLKHNPKDEAALFLSGKIDLNYVWLQLSTLGRRTGWGEYWNARRAMDAVLRVSPTHVRARVARAWIDYIVDTRVPFVLKWMLGGGDKKRALRNVREAAAEKGVPAFDSAEARFGLWEMLVREKQMEEATEVARSLAVQFPDNQELRRFLGKVEGIGRSMGLSCPVTPSGNTAAHEEGCPDRPPRRRPAPL